MAVVATAIARLRSWRARPTDHGRNRTVYEPPPAAPATIAVHLRSVRAGSYALDVTNEGPGVARSVFIARPAGDAVHPPGMLRTPLPVQIPALYSGDQQAVPVHTTGNGILELTVDVGWIDVRGDRGATYTLHG